MFTWRLLVYADETSNDAAGQTRHLTFGGKLVVIDIDFSIPSDPSIIAPISKITLSIAPADDDSISALGPAAAHVLTTNFHDQDGEAFVRNLTNIARWEGCSDPPNEGLNSFAVLKGVEDALGLIYSQELRSTTEEQVRLKGWGKPERNQRNLVGLSISFTQRLAVLVGVEARRPHFVHSPLQSTYLAENPFVVDDIGMFPGGDGPTSAFLGEQIPNWVEQTLDRDMMIHGANCSLVMDLSEPIVMSVEAAKKVCEIVGYGGWNDVLNGVIKDEWIVDDTMLEELLVRPFGIFSSFKFDSVPGSSTVEVELPG